MSSVLRRGGENLLFGQVTFKIALIVKDTKNADCALLAIAATVDDEVPALRARLRL